jgi:hypothetical protein
VKAIASGRMRAGALSKWPFVGLVLACSSGAVWSQAATLCSSDGRTYTSVQPCPSQPSPVRSAVPTVQEPRSSGSTGTRSPDKPGDQLQFQSPLCAELSEGMRTGASRGLGSSAQQELREAYRRLCSEDARRALQQMKDEMIRQRDLREQEARTARFEQDRDKLTREQCAEMLRIAQGKRQRFESMTAGERTDFDRFEATRRTRCGG